MGMCYELECEKCGYRFYASFGVGFMYPQVYQETKTAALNGELGEEIQKFLQENPDGAVNASRIFGKCTKCGNLETVPDLTMYLPNEKNPAPKKNPQERWSVAMPFYNADYVAPFDLQYHYKVFAKYQHKCKRCGGDLETFNEDVFKVSETNGKLNLDSPKLKCPNCHAALNLIDLLRWD